MIDMADHDWIELAHTPICRACGAVRRPNGKILLPIGAIPTRSACEAKSTRRVVDGVIVDGPPS